MLMINKTRLFIHAYAHKFLIITACYGFANACKLLLPGQLGCTYAPVALALLGAFGGAMGTAVLGVRSALLLCAALLGVGTHTFFGLPTVCASLYWSTRSGWLRVAMPASCIFLFLVHPVGYSAAAYTIFWFIPMIVACCAYSSLLICFGTVFTAHAVGSVMHLYLINSLSAQAWLALMPLVVLERCVLALSMWVAYVCLQKLFCMHVYKQGTSLSIADIT